MHKVPLFISDSYEEEHCAHLVRIMNRVILLIWARL